MDLPVEDHFDVQQSVFLDHQAGWEGVFVPAEKDAGRDRLDIHRGRLDDLPVVRGVFKDFLVEFFVFAPAGDRVKAVKVIGECRDIHIAAHEIGRVAVVLTGGEITADHELKKSDVFIGHARILFNNGPSRKDLGARTSV